MESDVRPSKRPCWREDIENTSSGTEAVESDVGPSERPCRREDTENTSTSYADEFTNYDVFISHRGPDTKTGFVSYLRKDLEAAGLQMFLDCISIDKGEESWECIEHAIKKTPIAVVVFSKSFTASEWCLRELDVMLSTGVKVLPIFYNVKPSEVRRLGSGQLKDGFKKLSRRHDKTVIERWRGRLKEASNLNGWEHAGVHKRLEADLVSDVVGKILALANKPLPLFVGDYVVGVKQVAEEIIQTLEDRKEVLLLGLWGMGGIGKSTLAKELYNQMSKRYDSACYIEDVIEKVTQSGVMKVQQHIMKDLCKNNSVDIEGKCRGKTILEERLCKKRFLLVLDDVRDNDELEYWISSKMLAEGSMCIVTTHNRSVFGMSASFEVEREVYIHDVQGLSIKNSERVFMSYAFGGYWKMKPGFEEMVSSISKGCGGVLLVLKVCGALLKNMDDEDVWKEVMAKLNHGTIMDEKKIFECLRISYDALSIEQQEMFLDIACTLIGKHILLVMRAWKSLKRSPKLGIQSLVEKALIIVDKEGGLKMHDLLRDMGREIVRKKRESDGIMRRLWMPESLTLLGKNEGLPNSLQTLILYKPFTTDVIDLDVSNMKDLYILMCNGSLKVLSPLPQSICWFRHSNQNDVYENFPIIPQNNELAILELMNCKFYKLPNSFEELRNLEVLNLSWCINLIDLPESIGELSNLVVLDLSGCNNFTSLPNSFGRLKKMRKLKLNNSRIKCWPNSFGELIKLEVLNLSSCSYLTKLPDSFGGVKKMRVEDRQLRKVEDRQLRN